MKTTTEQKTASAKTVLLEYSRYSITPEFARRICDAFGVEFNDKLVYTGSSYRETVYNGQEETPRVKTPSLAAHINAALGLKPDQKLLETANKMLGVGSHMNLKTRAYAEPLPEGGPVVL